MNTIMNTIMNTVLNVDNVNILVAVLAAGQSTLHIFIFVAFLVTQGDPWN